MHYALSSLVAADEVDALESKINRLSQGSAAQRGAGGNVAQAEGSAAQAAPSPQLDGNGELPLSGSFSEAGDSALAKVGVGG
jgi:hypothetical protein